MTPKPIKFEILGQEIDIIYRDSLSNERDANGEAHFRDNQIWIQRDVKGCPRKEEQIEETFWHEVTHIILEKLQYQKLSENEEFVGRFGSALQQVVKTLQRDLID